MRTLFTNGFVWQWSDKTIEHLKNGQFNHFEGSFVKTDFLVEGNKFLIGENANNTNAERVINIDQKYVIPGLIDSHMHLAWTSEKNEFCDLSQCKNTNELKDTLYKFVEKKKKQQTLLDVETNGAIENSDGSNVNQTNQVSLKNAEPIMGFGYKICKETNENDKQDKVCNEEKEQVDRAFLDKLFPDQSVIIMSTCLHFSILNTVALEQCDLIKYECTEDIIKDVDCYSKEELESKNIELGERKRVLNGTIRENIAHGIYFEMVKKMFNENKRMSSINAELEKLIKTGLTSIQTCDKNLGGIYTKLENQKCLPIRIFGIEFGCSIFEFLFSHYGMDSVKESTSVDTYQELLHKIEEDKERDNTMRKLKSHFHIPLEDPQGVMKPSLTCKTEEHRNEQKDWNGPISNNDTQGTEETSSSMENSLFSCNRIKFFCDGSLGGRNAATYLPYKIESNNEFEEANYGMITKPLLLSTQLKIAKLLNLRAELHSIGDRCTDFILNEIINNFKNHDRYILVHVQLLHKHLVEKLKNANLAVSMQPSFLSSDYSYIQNSIHSYYKDYSYIAKEFLNHNIVTAMGSDSPVEIYSPLVGIFDSMFRQIKKVFPLSYLEAVFEGEVLLQKKKELEDSLMNIENIINHNYKEEEKLTFSEALALYTINAAFIAKAEFFNQNNKIKLGAIVNQANADFVILDKDISKNSERNLLTCKIEQVWVNGALHHDNSCVNN